MEISIKDKLKKYPVPDFVWEEYYLDQRINDRGIALDMDLVRSAIAIDKRSKDLLTQKMQELTNLDNPNSVQQMKEWLSDNGMEMGSLGKKEVTEVLKTAPEPLRTVLSLRQQLAKSSVKKYQAMENAVCSDGRARGMFVFYGANRSGRYSSRLIQLQNLAKNHMEDLDEARELVKSGNFEALELLYDDIPDTLSQLVRTAFIPRSGYKFVVSDFSAIEARVLAWLAGEQWVLDVFASGGDIYCETASRMFGVPVEKHGINSSLRQKGKQATLSCGYGGGVGALKAMGAIEAGMKEEELGPLVEAWRASNPNIVKLWWDVDKAAKTAVKEKTTVTTHGLEFKCESGMLFIKLPSGRSLSYVKPRIGENKFGGESVTYEGIGTMKKWERIESYGPKFVENCIAEGSLVITDCGLVPIEKVKKRMWVWDGKYYVPHDGVVCKGVQDVICVNGIYMTPDHKILTDEGWMKSAESAGLKWKEFKLPACFRAHRNHPGVKTPMDVDITYPHTQKVVYDILNCGEEHRFGVWNGDQVLIVSNCVQAISRDILMYAMKTLSEYFICAHVHDELIIECKKDVSVDSICSLMGLTPPWIEGLSLLADGYECNFYKKS